MGGGGGGGGGVLSCMCSFVVNARLCFLVFFLLLLISLFLTVTSITVSVLFAIIRGKH